MILVAWAIFVAVGMVAGMLFLILLKLGDIEEVMQADLYERAEQIARDIVLGRQKLN